MDAVRERLEALEDAAGERGLTPVAWWIGSTHHDEVRQALAEEEAWSIETEDGMLVAIEGRDVKILTESPRRFALWCEEGALDL